jgi:hypothetical protein
MDKRLATWCGGIIPRGWYYQEQLNYCRLYQVQLAGAFDVAAKRFRRINGSQFSQFDREFLAAR